MAKIFLGLFLGGFGLISIYLGITGGGVAMLMAGVFMLPALTILSGIGLVAVGVWIWRGP